MDVDGQRLARLPLDRKVLADGECLPFADQEFDLVLGTHAFHHFKNPRMGMLECLRVGRTLAFMEPLTSPVVKILMRMGVIAEDEEGFKVHRFDLNELSSNWFDSRLYQMYQETYLYKHVPWIYPFLDRITSARVVALMRTTYEFMDHVLLFLHTKSVVVVTKR